MGGVGGVWWEEHRPSLPVSNTISSRKTLSEEVGEHKNSGSPFRLWSSGGVCGTGPQLSSL